jgi:hypothetical protein
MASAVEDGKKLEFEPTIKNTIKTLRKQLNKPQNMVSSASMSRLFSPQVSSTAGFPTATPLPPKTSGLDDTAELHARAQVAIAMGRTYIY